MTSYASGEVPDQADYARRLQRFALLRQMGRYRQAFEEAGSLCANFPGSAQAHLVLAYALNDLGRADEARREAYEALALEPEYAGAAFKAAELAPTWDERRDLMRRVVELDPGDGMALAHLALAERWCGAGRKRCRELAREALKASPQDASVYVIVAELERTYSVKQAQARVNEALSLEPDHAGALELQAKMADGTAHLREASATLAAALAVDPTNKQLASGMHELGSKVYRPLGFLIFVEIIIIVLGGLASRGVSALDSDVRASTELSFTLTLGLLWLVFGGVAVWCSWQARRGLGAQRAVIMSNYRRSSMTAVPVGATVISSAVVQFVLCITLHSLSVVWWAAVIVLTLTLAVVLISIKVRAGGRKGKP